MKLITIEGHDGFKAHIFPEHVKAFGMDPGPRFWCSADKEYSTAVRPLEQFHACRELLEQYHSHSPVKGVSGAGKL